MMTSGGERLHYYIWDKRITNDKALVSEAKISGLKKYLIWLILLTASFDIFGVVRIAGMTFRIAQLLTILSILVLFSDGMMKLPYAYKPLSIWLALQFIFACRSTNLVFSFGYFFWTILSITLIFVFYNFVNTKRKADWLLKAFAISFVAMDIRSHREIFLFDASNV